MKKFLTMLAITLMATLVFTSCSSDDDSPKQDTTSILGVWKVTSAQGYCAFGEGGPVEFNVTFDKDFERYKETTDYYVYREFCSCFKFYDSGEVDIFYGKWHSVLDDYLWDEEDKDEAIYILRNKQITIQCADYNAETAEEDGCFKTTYTIKHKDGNTMQWYAEQDGQWVLLTLKKY